MKAVIMAGGEGSRLRPLTCSRPKPMVPVVNRPMMEYTIELLHEHGCRDIAVTLQYLPEKIKEHFGNGGGFDVSLSYYIEEAPLGTAGSVRNASSFLNETFVVISGDALTDFNLTEAIAFHRSRGAMATLILTPVENPLEYGVVMTDSAGKIERFLEKPGWGEVFSDTVNTGIYILEPELLDLVEPGKPYDFSKDIFPLLLAEKKPIYGCILEGFWCDIGDLKEYCRAHRQVLQGAVRVKLKGSQVEHGLWLEEGVEISPLARLEAPLYVGRGSFIAAGAQIQDGSVLGSYTGVGERATIKRGITWEGAHLGRASALRGGILCCSAGIAAHAAVFEEAVIGDRSIVQEGAVVKPGVKVWPAKVVESGVVLQESLIWAEKASRSIFGRDGVRGELNRNITPEVAVRLGAVFGSLVGKGAVLCSSDASRSAAMLKKALISGILSTGVAVIDAGQLIPPMVRRIVKLVAVQGAVHLSLLEASGLNLLIRFYDEHGLPLSRGQERKVEQLYFREDFHRSPAGLIGEIIQLSGVAELYRQELLKEIMVDKIMKSGVRVVIGFPSSFIRAFLIPLLQQLNCTVITINSGSEALPEASADLSLAPHHEEQVTKAVRCNSAALGVIFEEEGERALLFDERGKAVGSELYRALLSLLVFRKQPGGAVTVPVNSSHVVEKLAARYQGQVFRSSMAPRNLMERENLLAQQGCRSPVSLQFDGIAVLLHLLDAMAAHDLTLAGLLEEIPAIRIQEREIPCPWPQKGKIMRRLVEEAAQGKTEMIDGLKIYHPQGWALILPDAEKPAYHIYGEGFSEEISASLTDFYVQKINLLQRET